MALHDYFQRREREEEAYRWTLQETHVPDEDLDDLASELAAVFIFDRCPRQIAAAWQNRGRGGPPHSASQSEVLTAFIQPTFGLPDDEESDAEEEVVPEHVQGAVAEQLWYYLQSEAAEDESIVHLEPPDLDPTSGGGDSLAVHRSNGGLLFRLWELKKCTAHSLAPTLNRAYDQLSERGARYLAQMTSIGEHHPDQELAEFFGMLPVMWVDGSEQAAAGISVAIPRRLLPARDCFTDFPIRFPEFANPNRLRGLLTAVGEFTNFVRVVREEIWSGL